MWKSNLIQGKNFLKYKTNYDLINIRVFYKKRKYNKK